MSKGEIKFKDVIPSDMVDLVYTIRGKRVMLDRDIAIMYETETRTINQQVKRNPGRFDEGNHFFKLSKAEFKELREILISQNVISSWGGVRYPPSAFTQKGIYVLATVLRSTAAHEVTKHIVNTFTETQNILDSNRQLKSRVMKIEKDASAQNKIIRTLSLIANELQKKS